ncbi:YbaN family protein [Alcaligenaceae bacterium]|nr:YbaN family protein [Alcaligenaceae bacterium]
MIKILFNTVGTLALVLAVLGLFLPLLPTTPFLLLASACYLRGSERLHGWLMSNKVFGPYLTNMQNGRGIPMRSKITALCFLWISLAFSAWFIDIPWVRLFLLIPGVGVTIYLLRAKTLPAAPAQTKACD